MYTYVQYLYNVAIDHIQSGNEPILELFHRELWCQVESFEILNVHE